MHTIDQLKKLSSQDLLRLATELSIVDPNKSEKEALMYQILDEEAVRAVKENVQSTSQVTNIKEPNSKKRHSHSKKGANKSTQYAPNNKNDNIETTHKSSQNFNGDIQEKNPRSKKSVNIELLANLVTGEGVLETMQEGYGFLRSADYNYLSSIDDIYISQNLIKSWGLKRGDTVRGKIRPPKSREKFFGLLDIESVNGLTLEELRKRKDFQDLVPIFPTKRFHLSTESTQYGNRIIDLFSPLGFGQRAIILSPPKAGKTTLLKNIAQGISKNHPSTYIIILMIDERPEEVTDMRRSVSADVIASTFDEASTNHVKVAAMAMEKAKRLVECEYDVALFIDSLSRLGHAYNNTLPSSGKTLSGGVDPNALHMLKRIFGIGRNIDGPGSLTVIASLLIDTGSKLETIFKEEMQGRGNTDIVLDRGLAQKALFPAIDIQRSGTRRGEILYTPEESKYINILRRVMSDMSSPGERIKFLRDNMKGTTNNKEFLARMRF